MVTTHVLNFSWFKITKFTSHSYLIYLYWSSMSSSYLTRLSLDISSMIIAGERELGEFHTNSESLCPEMTGTSTWIRQITSPYLDFTRRRDIIFLKRETQGLMK